MSDIIKIVTPQLNNKFNPIEGPCSYDLWDRLSQLDNQEKETLIAETKLILSNCISPEETAGQTTGIVIGYVQSGKTLSFTSLTALAADNKFKIIIFLAGIKKNLLTQTTKRLKKDLQTESKNSKVYKVFQGPQKKDNYHIRIANALRQSQQPAILITVLKHYDHINELTEIFKSQELLSVIKGKGVLIIDDEADQASLNTYARKNSKSPDWEDDEFSSTYTSILNLRASLQNHSYIQYTATPQGPLLINLMDLLSPKFHVVLTPGKSYTGGKVFFIDNPDIILTIPKNQVFHNKYNNLVECPQTLVDALQVFLIGTAIVVNIEKRETFLSMMIHADKLVKASEKFLEWVKQLQETWRSIFTMQHNDPTKIELFEAFKENYLEATRRINNPPSFDIVMQEVLQIMLDTNTELVIQGSEEIDWASASAHILIGADMLNRGFTVENLSVSYMPRYSVGKSNADTIQQRCRFFGYKLNYLDSCRVWLPGESVLEYHEYVKDEEIMRTHLKSHTLEETEQLLILSPSMNPTRNNILSKDVVRHKLSGWRQFNAVGHIDENIKYVSNFLVNKKFDLFQNYNTPDRNHKIVKLTIDEIIEFLKSFKVSNVSDTLRKSSTIQYLKYLEKNEGLKYGHVVQMAFEVVDGRERSLIIDNDVLKINNIFSGRSTTGSSVYPGDKSICIDDSFCIQIHKIKLKHSSIKWDKVELYTLGIYYPETFEHSFVGIKNSI
jgi:hypothetical protein